MRRGIAVGRYELGEVVGRGGMATVWAARHHTLGTPHALKLLDAVTPGPRRRLQREGALQARLDPDHVVPVTEVVVDQDLVALVMPLVRGCSLAELLAVYRPCDTEVRTLFEALLDGVEVAHDAGIVHRDLKPANVLLDVHRGSVRTRVADFGVALAAGESGAGGFVGTPAYAAPEQRAGAPLDGRADLWSLGAILVELVSGRRLADGGRVPPDSPWRPLADVLLATSPEDRLASASAARALLPGAVDPGALVVGRPLATALRRVQQGRQSTAPAADGATLLTWTDSSSDDLPPHDLPGPPIPLIGRDDALARLIRTLRGSDPVTWVHGPAGVGKTALALAAAWTLVPERDGGTWWVSAEGAAGVQDLRGAVARALGIEPAQASSEVLGTALEARGRALIVIDGAEPPMDGRTVASLATGAPDMRYLVTSRTAPDDGSGMALEPLSVADAASLLRRVHAAPLSEARAEALVQNVDRLPLAIELLAARESLPTDPAEVGVDLRGTLLSSWEPLSEEQRRTLASLSIFEGAFDLDAALGILAPTAPQTPPLELLDQLVAQSLIRPLGEGWFRLLRVVRALAAGSMDDPDPVRRARARYLAGFGRPEALDDLEGPGGPARLLALGRHREDLIQACRSDHALVSASTATALALACWAVLETRGPLEVGPELLGTARSRGDLAPADEVRLDIALCWALALDERHEEAGRVETRARVAAERLSDPALLARVHLVRGRRALRRHEPAETESAAVLALSLSEDARTRCLAQQVRGSAAMLAGRPDEAVGYLDEAATLAVERGDRVREGRIRLNLANVLAERDEASRSLEQYERALEVFDETGQRRARAIAMANLALLHRQRGDLAEAARTLDTARREHLTIGNRKSAAIALTYRGTTQTLAGELDAAEASFEEAERDLKTLGQSAMAAEARGHLGSLLYQRGRHDEARPLLEDALRVHRDCGYQRACSTWLRFLAQVAAAAGEPWEALVEQSLEAADGSPTGRADTLAVRALLRLSAGRVPEARADVQEALACSSATLIRAHTRRVDALVAQAEGRHQAALDALAEAVDLADGAGLGAGAPLRLQLRAARVALSQRQPRSMIP